MDWSKAKTILIVALIITNSLLLYVLYINDDYKDATLAESFIEDSKQLLENKDIKLNTKIPRDIPDLYGLTVEYEILDSTTLNNNFFNGQGNVEPKVEGLLEISYDDELLTLINEKLIIYESKTNDLVYDIKSQEDAINIATNFLVDKEFNISDMELSFVKEIDGVYYLEFTKIFDDIYMESTFTNLQIDNTGVKKLDRTWLNMNEAGATKLKISSAPKSILALISMEEVYGKVIKDISICYYFDPEKQEYVEDPGRAQQGSTDLAWRIQFEDGYKVFIDNYDNY